MSLLVRPGWRKQNCIILVLLPNACKNNNNNKKSVSCEFMLCVIISGKRAGKGLRLSTLRDWHRHRQSPLIRGAVLFQFLDCSHRFFASQLWNGRHREEEWRSIPEALHTLYERLSNQTALYVFMEGICSRLLYWVSLILLAWAPSAILFKRVAVVTVVALLV